MSLLVLRLLSRRGELKQKDGKDISRDMVPFDAVSDAYEQLTGEIKRFLKDPEWAAEGKKNSLVRSGAFFKTSLQHVTAHVCKCNSPKSQKKQTRQRTRDGLSKVCSYVVT